MKGGRGERHVKMEGGREERERGLSITSCSTTKQYFR